MSFVLGDPVPGEVATKMPLFVKGTADEVLRLGMLVTVSWELSIIRLAVLILATFSAAVTVAAGNVVVSS